MCYDCDEYDDYDYEDYEDICPNCNHHWENCWCDPDTIAPYIRHFPDEAIEPMDKQEAYYESGAYYDDLPDMTDEEPEDTDEGIYLYIPIHPGNDQDLEHLYFESEESESDTNE